MVKPLHAGDAAASGLSAASLAAHGFEANLEAIETAQGFADTHADAFEAERIWDVPEGGFVRGTLFKYHAACYLTHSAIEAVRAFRAEGLAQDDVESMTIRVPKTHLKVCNIHDPATGLEAKFSLRQTAAMALTGIPTGDPEIYTDAIAQDADLTALRNRIRVEAADREGGLWSEVIVKARGQDRRAKDADTGVPALDLAIQADALGEKFRALTIPRLGLERAERLEAAARDVAHLDGVSLLAELTRPIPA
jgi:2-methylcitrate dehydratase PrpD